MAYNHLEILKEWNATLHTPLKSFWNTDATLHMCKKHIGLIKRRIKINFVLIFEARTFTKCNE